MNDSFLGEEDNNFNRNRINFFKMIVEYIPLKIREINAI